MSFPKYLVEFTEHDDPREKASFCERIETDDPQPIAGVGDHVYIPDNGDGKALTLIVVRRTFMYHPDFTHVQLFCKERK